MIMKARMIVRITNICPVELHSDHIANGIVAAITSASMARSESAASAAVIDFL